MDCPLSTILDYEASLNPKGLPTATGLIGIGIGELETTADHGVAIVQHQTVEIK
jgi:hypothetical protein